MRGGRNAQLAAFLLKMSLLANTAQHSVKRKEETGRLSRESKKT